MEVRSVVVGVDGSPESLAAAGWGAAEAASRGLRARLLCALTRKALGDVPPVTDEERDSRPPVRRVLDAAAERAAAVAPEAEVAAEWTEDGSAVQSLLHTAGDDGLLVLGSRGLGPVSGFVVGSVGLSSVAHAAAPVVCVRRESPVAYGAGPVVAGLDLEADYGPVLDYAFEAAARWGSVLRVAHAWSPRSMYAYPSALPDPQVVDAAAREIRHRYNRALEPWRERYGGVQVENHPVRAETAPYLVHLTADAALLVVGRRTRGHPYPTRIGPVTHSVLHHVACPVAVVPHE